MKKIIFSIALLLLTTAIAYIWVERVNSKVKDIDTDRYEFKARTKAEKERRYNEHVSNILNAGYYIDKNGDVQTNLHKFIQNEDEGYYSIGSQLKEIDGVFYEK